MIWLRKWSTIFSVFVQDNLVYRSQAFIWMMTDTVPAVIMPLVWLSSYNGRSEIRGYDPSAMVTYYVATLALSNFMVAHIMWDIAHDIREGRFSVHLTRPFGYRAYQYAGNLSWRLMRLTLFIPVLFVVMLIFRSEFDWRNYTFSGAFFAAVVGGHLLSFSVSFAMGLLALLFTEVRSIFMFYYMPLSLLSGGMVPLRMLPSYAQDLAVMAPFRYTLSFPVEILLGQLNAAQTVRGFAILGGWLVAMHVMSLVLWRVGTRQYTGVGM